MEKIKKYKWFILVLTILIFIIVANINIYNTTGKNVVAYIKEYYFAKVINLDEVYELEKYNKTNQVLKIEDYTFIMDQYFLDNNNSSGCCRIKISKENTDMRDIYIKEDYFFANFGEGYRFTFSAWASDVNSGNVGTTTERVRTIKKKDVMYLYYKFYSDDGLTYDGKVYLKDSNVEYPIEGNYPKNQVGCFDLKK